MRNDFSEYIIFADESGDHGITSINPENPVFVLVFCIFRKTDYISIVKQAVAKLKIDFWGHDLKIKQPLLIGFGLMPRADPGFFEKKATASVDNPHHC